MRDASTDGNGMPYASYSICAPAGAEAEVGPAARQVVDGGRWRWPAPPGGGSRRSTRATRTAPASCRRPARRGWRPPRGTSASSASVGARRSGPRSRSSRSRGPRCAATARRSSSMSIVLQPGVHPEHGHGRRSRPGLAPDSALLPLRGTRRRHALPVPASRRSDATRTPTGSSSSTTRSANPTDPPLLLVMGLGAQMTPWDEGFCQRLADEGRYVIRFDNRDVGLSTKFDGRPFDLAAILGALFGGERARSRCPTRSPTWPTTRSGCSTPSASRRPTSSARRWAG